MASRLLKGLRVTAATLFAFLLIASGALAVSTDGQDAEGQALALGDVLAVGVAGSLIGPEPAPQSYKLASNAR